MIEHTMPPCAVRARASARVRRGRMQKLAKPETTLKRRIASMRRFLANGGASGTRGAGRVYGAGRFDPARAPSDEWAAFGTHYFFLPTLECVEGVTCATLAVCAAMDANGAEYCGPSAKSFVQAIDDACETLDRALSGGVDGAVLKGHPLYREISYEGKSRIKGILF